MTFGDGSLKNGLAEGVLKWMCLVDTSQFEDAIGAHDWGLSLLRPLPQTLNTRQSLDMGIGGLELQATPTKVGQHTLEMR